MENRGIEATFVLVRVDNKIKKPGPVFQAITRAAYENGVGTPKDECVLGLERSMASKMKAWSVEPVHHDEPPLMTDWIELVILQTPAPQ